MIECLFDAYNIDDFSDDNFDIVVLDAGSDRTLTNYLYEKCKNASGLNTISFEKFLPIIVNGKNLLNENEKVTVAFADMFYKISCDRNCNIIINEISQNKAAIQLNDNDFTCKYNPSANKNCDESKLKEAEIKCNKYKVELAKYIFKEALENHKSGNYEKAFTLYKAAADLDNLPSVLGLGWMYDMGQGVKQNYEKAVAMYRKAAAQGNDIALNNLGAKFENGRAWKKIMKRQSNFTAKRQHKAINWHVIT